MYKFNFIPNSINVLFNTIALYLKIFTTKILILYEKKS